MSVQAQKPGAMQADLWACFKCREYGKVFRNRDGEANQHCGKCGSLRTFYSVPLNPVEHGPD